MKKKSVYVILIVSIVLVWAFLISAILISNKKNNFNDIFNTWYPETDERVVSVLRTEILSDGKERLNLNERLQNGRVNEVFCILNKRIYFCYETYDADRDIWHIASTDVAGSEVTDHFEGCMLPNSRGQTYRKLSYDSPPYHVPGEEKYGGYYSDKKYTCMVTKKTSCMILRTTVWRKSTFCRRDFTGILQAIVKF